MLPTTHIADAMDQMRLPTPQTDPPPYQDSLNSDFDLDDASDGEDTHQPLTLTINAASSIHGSNNLVQTPPPPFAEISSLSASLLQTMNQIDITNNFSAAMTPGKPQRVLKVDLTINCGITLIGDRNVVGGIGLRYRGAATAAARAGPSGMADAPVVDAASVGAKRKAKDVSD